jgi:FkbM family methyltransferase
MKTQRFETETGTYWLPTDAPDDVIVRNIMDGYVFELQNLEPIINRANKQSVVIDVGPCFGQMSVLLSKHAKKVIAIEASADMATLCLMNFDENGCDNIELIHAAAWDKPGEIVKFMDYEFSHYKSYGCFGIGAGKTEVKTITIDSLGISDPVSSIKIDAQGADLHVMRGAEQTIRRNKCSVHFEYEDKYDQQFGVSWSQYEEFIRRIGYKIMKKVNDWNFIIESEA